ncbi:hypothetical protein CA13_03870 [Planctomycetes bacterium CA13]|uniref:Uncharacterized protein n=1 Tax=Novipirellula herctigrandis TaxID=2527986 RepID=A0A5C5YVW9_9BACT|nr:hypothetical protein CA13_03870 [Planctomycetes bacterium CA13]
MRGTLGSLSDQDKRVLARSIEPNWRCQSGCPDRKKPSRIFNSATPNTLQLLVGRLDQEIGKTAVDQQRERRNLRL